ncbi:5-oxoprolinase subunit PxpB [Zoogloea sp.]|uniref:5-oxoprolinase subunit PxpB n=1 Tax=Zoogloea sp. TaxID=49181 RepID=UPI0025DC8389|nr:5-oxoprolinase subunit PxpB [Zoogloea sp.]MCK6393535.1 5-oxoprolinase subunit PxpB [Zoogloea sp.]
MHPQPRLLALGDAAFTVEFGEPAARQITPDIQARVLGLAAALAELHAAGELPGVIEWVPAFRSVTVHFDPDRCPPRHLATRLQALAAEGRQATGSGREWTIPVCFEGDFAPDLDAVAAARGLSREAVVAQLIATEFIVCMLGFLPGFPYLDGLPASLEMPRLATPRPRVPAGSVAIAGRMGAIYPWDSPGGWRLVGRSPVSLFDAHRAERPALFAPGDRVRWQAVGADALARP